MWCPSLFLLQIARTLEKNSIVISQNGFNIGVKMLATVLRNRDKNR